MEMPKVGSYVLYDGFVGIVTESFDDLFILEGDGRFELVCWMDDWKLY